MSLSSEMNTAPCTVCKEQGHSGSHCPTLVAPLQPGFYAPSGGYQGGGEEEDQLFLLTATRYGRLLYRSTLYYWGVPAGQEPGPGSFFYRAYSQGLFKQFDSLQTSAQITQWVPLTQERVFF